MYCEFIKSDLTCNCIVKSCTYNINNSKFFNCVLKYLQNSEKKNFTIEDISEITKFSIEEIEAVNNNTLNKIRLKVFSDKIKDKTLNRIYHFKNLNICNNCNISLVNKAIFEQDGFRFCSNKCLSNKSKLILENQFKTEISEVIKEAIKLFGNIEIISNVLSLNRKQLEYLLAKYYPEDLSLYRYKKLNIKKRIDLTKFEATMKRLRNGVFVRPKQSLCKEYNRIKNILTEDVIL